MRFMTVMMLIEVKLIFILSCLRKLISLKLICYRIYTMYWKQSVRAIYIFNSTLQNWNR